MGHSYLIADVSNNPYFSCYFVTEVIKNRLYVTEAPICYSVIITDFNRALYNHVFWAVIRYLLMF